MMLRDFNIKVVLACTLVIMSFRSFANTLCSVHLNVIFRIFMKEEDCVIVVYVSDQINWAAMESLHLDQI